MVCSNSTSPLSPLMAAVRTVPSYGVERVGDVGRAKDRRNPAGPSITDGRSFGGAFSHLGRAISHDKIPYAKTVSSETGEMGIRSVVYFRTR